MDAQSIRFLYQVLGYISDTRFRCLHYWKGLLGIIYMLSSLLEQYVEFQCVRSRPDLRAVH